MGAQVTKLELLKEYSKGAVVELPAFAEGQQFFARIKRPSMLALVKSGKIPNSLLTKANALFSEGSGSFDTEDEHAMSDMLDIMDTICEASFVEPSYKELTEAEVELTDEQRMFVFQYSQVGVKALEPFRQQ